MAPPATDIDTRAVIEPPGLIAGTALCAGSVLGAGTDRTSEPITLADSLMIEAGWSPTNFGEEGPNPPYLRIGGKLWVTLTEFEPCFSSFHRDRVLFRSKVSMAEHLQKYDQIMIDPLAFEECYGPEEGTEATFPFGSWLSIRAVEFDGLQLWGRRHGRVVLPLEPLAIASAIWLRNHGAPAVA